MSIVYSVGQSKEIVAHLMKLLTTTLYSNKYEACFREILSNALDANVGQSQPVRVEFLSTTKTALIRDYGSGMSPDFIVNVFTVFGATTKTGDDSQIGGFGIGAKSIFVHPCVRFFTIYNGKKYEYETSLTPDGQLPQLTLVDEYCTDEPSGTGFFLPYEPINYKKTLTDNIIDTLLINAFIGKIEIIGNACLPKRDIMVLTDASDVPIGYCVINTSCRNSDFYNRPIEDILLYHAYNFLKSPNSTHSYGSGIIRNGIVYRFNSSNYLQLYKIDNQATTSANRETINEYQTTSYLQKLDREFCHTVFLTFVQKNFERQPFLQLLQRLLVPEIYVKFFTSARFLTEIPRTSAVLTLITRLKIPQLRNRTITSSVLNIVEKHFESILTRLESSESVTIAFCHKDQRVNTTKFTLTAYYDKAVYEYLATDSTLKNVTLVLKDMTNLPITISSSFQVTIYECFEDKCTTSKTKKIEKIRPIILKNGITTRIPKNVYFPYPLKFVYVQSFEIVQKLCKELNVKPDDYVFNDFYSLSTVEMLKYGGIDVILRQGLPSIDFSLSPRLIPSAFTQLTAAYTTLQSEPSYLLNLLTKKGIQVLDDSYFTISSDPVFLPSPEDDKFLNSTLELVIRDGIVFWEYDSHADAGLLFAHSYQQSITLIYTINESNFQQVQAAGLRFTLMMQHHYSCFQNVKEDPSLEFVLTTAIARLRRLNIPRYAIYCKPSNAPFPSYVQLLEITERLK